MKTAFVFPGQGSQHVGMGADLHGGFREARSIYDEASSVLGYDVAGLSFGGPEEELNKTEKTQPCILTASMAALRVLEARGIGADVMAGHSLGEYTALVAAGSISFKDALRLTATRGRFMQEAVAPGTGMMAALLGLGREKVVALCNEVSSGYVGPANFNCPGQIVISGETGAVKEAMALATGAGARRVVPLAVSVPSHSALMGGAAGELASYIDEEGIELGETSVDVISNVGARAFGTAADIKDGLIRQMTGAVLWEDSIKRMIDDGVGTFVEVGPSKVLSGLIKRISRDVKILGVRDRESLGTALKALMPA